jgi:hypothetical protein
MKIQTLTENLNIETLPYLSLNSSNNDLQYSNKCEVTILVIYQPNINPFIIVAADLIWFSEDIVENLKNKIIDLFRTDNNNIVFCASHSHGTPNPNKNILYGNEQKKFSNYLKNIIWMTLEKAYKLKKIKVLAQAITLPAPDISINRRRKAFQFKKFPFKIMQSLPNKNKPIDKDLNIIKFNNAINHKVECIIVKHTCHPVADPKGILGADYPGYLKIKLRKNISKHIVFLQGFCGDIRPKVIKSNNSIKDKMIKLIIGDRFRKTKEVDSSFIASQLEKSILVKNNNHNYIPIIGSMKSSSKKITILLENNLYAPIELEFTIWLWGNICFIFLNAEVLSSYIFKNIDNLNIINVGYTNGMFGYLPTTKDILEGGYEVDKSRRYFGITKRIHINNEKKIRSEIIAEIKSLINK